MGLEFDVAESNGSMTPGVHFTDAIEANGFVFVSGQLAFGTDGNIVGNDISGQTRRSLKNLSKVLAAHGLGPEDVIKITVWLTRASDFTRYNEAYASFFGKHRPARSTVVCDLVVPGALIELEAVARARSPGQP
jgi:2-iminobutanoate/2-iminopropanoate deaminase